MPHPLFGKNPRPRGPKVLSKVTINSLTDLFDVTNRTIYRWIKGGFLNPKSLISIIELYNKRYEEGKEQQTQGDTHNDSDSDANSGSNL